MITRIDEGYSSGKIKDRSGKRCLLWEEFGVISSRVCSKASGLVWSRLIMASWTSLASRNTHAGFAVKNDLRLGTA
jgi:hypothetical protein